MGDAPVIAVRNAGFLQKSDLLIHEDSPPAAPHAGDVIHGIGTVLSGQGFGQGCFLDHFTEMDAIGT